MRNESMPVLTVTIVGQELFKFAEEIFRTVEVNPISEPSKGMLGNLKTLTYSFCLSENEVIIKRREILRIAKKEPRLMTPMYVHGDWMSLFFIKPIRGAVIADE